MGRINDILDNCVKILSDYNQKMTLNSITDHDKVLGSLAMDCSNIIKFLVLKQEEILELEYENRELLDECLDLENKFYIIKSLLKEKAEDDFSNSELYDEMIEILGHDDVETEEDDEE